MGTPAESIVGQCQGHDISHPADAASILDALSRTGAISPPWKSHPFLLRAALGFSPCFGIVLSRFLPSLLFCSARCSFTLSASQSRFYQLQQAQQARTFSPSSRHICLSQSRVFPFSLLFLSPLSSSFSFFFLHRLAFARAGVFFAFASSFRFPPFSSFFFLFALSFACLATSLPYGRLCTLWCVFRHPLGCRSFSLSPAVRVTLSSVSLSRYTHSESQLPASKPAS